jgi:hypothetical protein
MRGLRFHEVGIFLRDPATYGQLLVETLQGLGIPCFLSDGAPLIRTPAGQQLLLLCRVLLEDYARSRMLEFIRGADPPFSALLGELADAARLTQWEIFSMRAGVVERWRECLPAPPVGSGKTKRQLPQPISGSYKPSFFIDGFLCQ